MPLLSFCFLCSKLPFFLSQLSFGQSHFCVVWLSELPSCSFLYHYYYCLFIIIIVYYCFCIIIIIVYYWFIILFICSYLFVYLSFPLDLQCICVAVLRSPSFSLASYLPAPLSHLRAYLSILCSIYFSLIYLCLLRIWYSLFFLWVLCNS